MVDTRVVWLRRDLRIDDNPALVAACDGGDDVRVVCLFVLDDVLLGSDRVAPARRALLADALSDLDAALRRRDGRLVVRRGDPRTVVPEVLAETSAAVLHRSAETTPYGRRRDADVDRALGDGVEVVEHTGSTIAPAGSVRTGSGTAFKVFTPFHTAWRRRDHGRPLDPPARIPAHGSIGSDGVPTRADLASDLDDAVAEHLPPSGETAARDRLDRFIDEQAGDYDEGRDTLAEDATSRLSGDLHLGCISGRRALSRCDRRNPGHAAFAAQLAWRDFYSHVMAEWPDVATAAFDQRMGSLPWHGDGDDLQAWKDGQTGHPIVDAGMRQLAATGWMHNRARMITASFLTKDLLVDWRLGEAHFLALLCDGDMANNNGGWQWAAGTGTDAQPYFRIFNPTTQGTRFDPDGTYVRRWVPELADVPSRWIHRPWEMDEQTQAGAGVRIGSDYPAPIVDHGEARRRALDWFSEHRR